MANINGKEVILDGKSLDEIGTWIASFSPTKNGRWIVLIISEAEALQYLPLIGARVSVGRFIYNLLVNTLKNQEKNPRGLCYHCFLNTRGYYVFQTYSKSGK